MSSLPTPSRRGFSFGGIFDPAHRHLTIALSFGIAVHGFNELSLAPVLPLALADLDGLEALPWAYAMFFTAVITGGVTSSALRAELGARGVMFAAVLVYGIGILLNATAAVPGQILVGRTAQGLADGWITALCYSLIPELFRRQLVPHVFAFEAVIWAGASTLGPTVGGAAVDFVGWRVAVCVAVPIIFGAGLSAIWLPASRGKASDRMRLSHLVTLVACVLAILVLLIPSALPSLPYSALAIPIGGLIFLMVLRHDSYRLEPLFPRQVFRLDGTVGLGGWVLLLVTAGQSISTVFMAYMVQRVFDLSAQLTGIIVVTLPLAWVLSAIPMGQVNSARVLRGLIRTGPAYQIIGAIGIIYGFSNGILSMVIAGQIVIGLGLGTIWGPINNAVFAAAEEDDRGRIASLLPPITSIGYVLGSGIGGWLAHSYGLFGGGDVISGIGTPRQAIAALWGTMVVFAVLALICAQRVQPAGDEPGD